MKKTALALVLASGLVAAPARPQSAVVSQIAGDGAATEKFHFGLSVGMNVAYLTGSGEGSERTGGFNVGLAATIRLSGRLSLSPEITLSSRKGIAAIPFVTTGDPALDAYFADLESSALALTYTDVPVLVAYRLGRFRLGAGPYLGLLGAAKETFRAERPEPGDDGVAELSFQRSVEDAYKKTDFGLVFEAAWTVAKPRRGAGLVFHLRYQAGLVDVAKAPAAGPLRNSVIQACVSFPFVR
jgi:hypothetical protein